MKKKTNQLARTAMTLLLAVLGSFMAVGTSFAAGGNPTNENSGDEPMESETVTIGKGDNYTDLPLTADYNYALTQQVFSAQEINHGKGKIWSIAFRTKNGDLARKYNVYLTHTDQSSMSSYSWQPVTEADCYFSGEVMFTSRQWNIIYFDKPFEYDGKSNIVVTVDDNTGRDDGWGSLTNAYFYGDGNHAIARSSTDIDPLDPTSIENTSNKSTYEYKNQIKFTFGDYPTPAYLAVAEVGDVSAQIQCSLRGDAKAWNVRYRKVAADGEEEQRWTQENDLTTRSFTIEDLKAFTKYEVQVQAVFAAEDEGSDDHLSDWTDALVFTTNCCPVEEQAEIIYAVNSNYSDWFGYAIQFVDITNEENPVEVAYVNPVDYNFTGGTLTLCCGHKYKVNWIYDEEHSNVNGSFSLALFFEPGDKFFSMARGEAPTSTSELTTFVMDCTPYCVQMPQIVNEAGVTYDSATLTFVSQTKTGQVVYSTEEDFDPETATPADADFEELPQSEDPWGGTPPNTSVTLRGLQPLTTYYVSVRSVCTIEPLSTSRWTPPVKVTTGSLYDGPTQPIAKPISSSSEGISWSGRGNETGYKLYYREQGAGNPVDPSAINTFGGGNGSGFGYGSWGDGIWSSYGDRPFSNTIFVSDVPGGSSFRFKAGNGKSGAGQTKIIYGMQKLQNGTPLEQMKKFDKKCLNDADRAAIIKELQNKIKELTDEEQIKAYKAEIEELNSLPTDAQKLEEMKTLEQKIKENNVAKAELTLKFVNGEITNEQYESKIYDLEVQNTMFKNKLSELRAITINAEDPNNDGFAINSTGQSPAQSRGLRAAEDETYIFFIRHSDPNGVLLVKDLTITPPENLGAWTVIDNIKGTEYTLTGLKPETAYEVMVEPVYDDGTTGTQSPITVFTTLGTETDPIESEFSVSEGKKVQFAKGNLQYSGDIYEGTWSIAPQQYDVLGEKNIEEGYESSWPASPTDLLCWSTVNNHYGVSTYYYYDDEEAQPYFKGDFVDWGSNPALIADLGAGWSTLSKDEWSYLLTERENAAQLQSFATIALDEENKVKGLVLLPDEWNAPDGVLLSDEMTTEQWAAVEQTGAIFLPVTGHLWVWKDGEGNNQASVNGLDVIGNYWTSTPSDEESGLLACALNFNTEVEPSAEMERRLGCAIRLVKTITPKQELQDDWIIAIDDLDCTDSDQMPTLIVKDGETTLQEGVDYTVTYTNNKNVGTATATITFVEGSKYIGTASVTFNILRDMSNVFSTNNSWATYVAKEDLTTPDGLQAYTISAATASEVTATPIDYIPVGLAVLLNRADASVSAYKAKAYTETPATVTSLLVGSAAETTSLTPYQDFILFNDEFVLSSAASVAAGHAYLPAAKVPAGARTMTIVIDGEATAINSMKITTADNDGWYTVDGRQLNRMPAAKGVYIHHGKKYVIK